MLTPVIWDEPLTNSTLEALSEFILCDMDYREDEEETD